MTHALLNSDIKYTGSCSSLVGEVHLVAWVAWAPWDQWGVMTLGVVGAALEASLGLEEWAALVVLWEVGITFGHCNTRIAFLLQWHSSQCQGIPG